MARIAQDSLGQDPRIRSVLRNKAIDMLVLAMLSRQAMYAREMLRQLSDVTDNVLAYDKLHTPLLRLQRQGLVCQTDTPPGGVAARVYFAITPAGRRRLTQMVGEYRRFNLAVEKVLAQIAEPEFAE